MEKEWPKELPPFEKMEEIFFKGGFDPDGEMRDFLSRNFDFDGTHHVDHVTGKKYLIDIEKNMVEEINVT